MPDDIVIIYWEGDDTRVLPFTKLEYVEWMRGAKSYYAHADESKFDPFGEFGDDLTEWEDDRGNYEHRGIPDDVREALALLIAPTLRRLS